VGNHFHFVVETPRANLCAGKLRMRHWRSAANAVRRRV
jgi:hypothetical protein